MAKLVFIDKDYSGQVYELVLEKTTVGRADSNKLVIHDPSVSFHHCEILTYGTEVIVRDLHSSNGTFVDNVKINQQGQIKSGQVVRFGSVGARLDLDLPPADDSDTAMTAVISLRQIERQQEEERKKPKPASDAMKLGPDIPSDATGHTVILRRPPPPQPEVVRVTDDKPADQGAKCGKGVILSIAVIVALGLIFLAWWMWGRK